MLDFCKEAVDKKVATVPGTAFLTDPTMPCSSFRINFSTPTDEQIIKGIEILSTLKK
jgi:2-aminoadipate transaminase